LATQDVTTVDEVSVTRRGTAIPYRACALIGLGGLFAGVTGPLLSTFIPPLVRDAVGEHRTLIGAIMAIDNVLLLALVPWAGPVSDRASARGRGRLPIIVAGLVLSALGMALLPSSAGFGLAFLIGALIILHTGINVKDPLNGRLFDLLGGYRALFLLMACYTALAFITVLFIPRGTGEADTGQDGVTPLQ